VAADVQKGGAHLMPPPPSWPKAGSDAKAATARDRKLSGKEEALLSRPLCGHAQGPRRWPLRLLGGLSVTMWTSQASAQQPPDAWAAGP